ncbi:unnamed protein product [Fusarium venenatum]|uniref:Uncharacterized protein n=1 Tax=Fusarium venenatum TaxID=56646 RepID=A0A2L2TH18_9HYPO|nr:LOW QUALITY PROTEIN: uncharacterized protein FVRRES_06762 [Fusarium venenatum]CEI62326.1 unnamed protein product [Fusarium venenatum]
MSSCLVHLFCQTDLFSFLERRSVACNFPGTLRLHSSQNVSNLCLLVNPHCTPEISVFCMGLLVAEAV